MKKSFYVFLSCYLMMSYGMHAQQTRFGVVAGTNYSSDNRVMAQTHLGVSGGVFLDITFKNNIFLRGEATYLVKQRADLSRSEDGKPAPYTVGAWQFPVNLGYRFKLGALQPYLQAGAYIHSAQNSLGKNQVGLSLEGRHKEYVRFTTGTGIQWKQVALELEWQIGNKTTRSDFSNWDNSNVNGIAAGGCIPPFGRYPIFVEDMPNSVRNDSFLLKFRYFFN